jgi:SAM-dependent methyltransferase
MAKIEYSGRDNLDVMLDAKNYNDFLLKLIRLPAKKNISIIDFGAGGGTFCLPLRAAGYQVACIETDPILSQKLTNAGLKVWDDIAMLEDESIDYIYSLNVLEHIENDDAIVALWHRKLRPGGSLLVYVPAFQVLFTSMDRKVGHYRRYRKQEIDQKLSSAGFHLDMTRYADSIGFFATLVYKLLGSNDGDINPRMLRIYDKWIFPASATLDKLANRLFGKNVYAFATKPTS